MKRSAAAFLLSAFLISAGTPAGMIIENTATYQDDQTTIQSNTVRVTVQSVCAADLSPKTAERPLAPGETITLPYVLTNVGNSVQTYPVGITGSGAALRVVADLNGNGLPDDQPVSTVTLNPDEHVTLLVIATADTAGAHTVTLSSGCAGALNATLTLNARHTAPLVTKTVVGPATIEENGTVQYRITVTNPEHVAMPDVTVTDDMNSALEYVEVTPQANVTATTLADGRTHLAWHTDLAAEESREYLLTARIRGGITDDSEVTNTATASNDGGSNTSTPPAVIRVYTSQILVSKAVTPQVVDAGGQVTYTVTVYNPSSSAITDAMMVDTPDKRLTVDPTSVRVDGKPAVATLNGGILSVSLGTVQSQGSATVTYTARVPIDTDGTPILNTVQAQARGRLGNTVSNITSNVAAANITVQPKLSISGSDLVGRVYLDRDLNQRYARETDTPVAGARVLLAGGREVTTDANGLYSFANVPNGTHAVRVDPQSVPYRPLDKPDSRHGMYEALSASVQVNALTVQDFPLVPASATISFGNRWEGPNTTVVFTRNQGILNYTVSNRSNYQVCLNVGAQHYTLGALQSMVAVMPMGDTVAVPRPQEAMCK